MLQQPQAKFGLTALIGWLGFSTYLYADLRHDHKFRDFTWLHWFLNPVTLGFALILSLVIWWPRLALSIMQAVRLDRPLHAVDLLSASVVFCLMVGFSGLAYLISGNIAMLRTVDYWGALLGAFAYTIVFALAIQRWQQRRSRKADFQEQGHSH